MNIIITENEFRDREARERQVQEESEMEALEWQAQEKLEMMNIIIANNKFRDTEAREKQAQEESKKFCDSFLPSNSKENCQYNNQLAKEDAAAHNGQYRFKHIEEHVVGSDHYPGESTCFRMYAGCVLHHSDHDCVKSDYGLDW